ncbi:MAG: efflux RND transporter periplasmic adaptor subunit [Desulfobacterales bacterium]|nr:efflux RND transporter periplasmic adaptor subunit [Desulfobacterales bacterium]MDX2511874.1 efflux RND transporter periplasmic adaptor subunit [Desulfobacterales bacterium]
MRKIFRLFAIILFVLIFLGTLAFLYIKSKPKTEPVKTVLPVKMDIVKKTVVTGSIVARREVEVKAQLSGIIDEVMVEAGDSVKKGQVLARLFLIPNLIRVNNAETRVKKARIALEDTNKTFERVKRRYETSIKGGSLLTQKQSPNLIKLHLAEKDVNQAELNLQDARNTYDREKELMDKKIIPESSFQDTLLQLSKAREEHDKAEKFYTMVRTETLDATEEEYQKAEIERKQAMEELAAAQSNLQLIREGVTPSTKDKSNTLIRATIDGSVLEVPVKEGSLVVETSTQSSGTTIAVVADMTDMIFEGNVDETEVGKLRQDMPLILTIGAIENRSFEARIEQIAPKGKEVNGTIQFGLRANVVLKADTFIRSGYSATADIVLEKRVNVLAIDEGNLIFNENSVFVAVQTAPQQFEKRKIKTGLSDGINIEVLSGLASGERIKVQGGGKY